MPDPTPLPSNNPITADNLGKIVSPVWTNESGDSFVVTAGDVMAANIRQMAKDMLRAVRPEVVAQYKLLKNKNRQPGKPATVADHRIACKYLFSEWVDTFVQIPGL